MCLGLSFQVILAAELLKSADELVKQKIHPTSVISGYRLACKYDLERFLPLFPQRDWSGRTFKPTMLCSHANLVSILQGGRPLHQWEPHYWDRRPGQRMFNQRSQDLHVLKDYWSVSFFFFKLCTYDLGPFYTENMQDKAFIDLNRWPSVMRTSLQTWWWMPPWLWSLWTPGVSPNTLSTLSTCWKPMAAVRRRASWSMDMHWTALLAHKVGLPHSSIWFAIDWIPI